MVRNEIKIEIIQFSSLKEEGASDRFLVSEYGDSLWFVFLAGSKKVFSRNLIYSLAPKMKTWTCDILR